MNELWARTKILAVEQGGRVGREGTHSRGGCGSGGSTHSRGGGGADGEPPILAGNAISVVNIQISTTAGRGTRE